MFYKKGFGANLNIMSLFMFNLSAVNPPVETLITTYNEAIFKLGPHQSKINANIEPASLNIICGLVAKTLYFYIITPSGVMLIVVVLNVMAPSIFSGF